MLPCTLETRKPGWSLQTAMQDVGTEKKQEIPVRTSLAQTTVCMSAKTWL
ncbi:mCG146866 [Mus musculus]|nr:mCG146866 [Mus musculus]